MAIRNVLKIHNPNLRQNLGYECVRGLRASWLEVIPFKKPENDEIPEIQNKGTDYPEQDQNPEENIGRYRGTQYPAED